MNGINRSIHTNGNEDGINKTIDAIKNAEEDLIFTNLVDFDISTATPEQLIGYFRDNNGNFNEFVEGLGLTPNATDAEIAKAVMEQGALYGQSGSMEGWRKVAEDGLKTITDTVIIGTKKVMETQIIPGKVTQEVIKEFDQVIGLENLKVLHVNDSKNPLASHKDRHENIGFGSLGFDTIMKIFNDSRFIDIPKILETPYVASLNNKENFPPYKYEIDMI